MGLRFRVRVQRSDLFVLRGLGCLGCLEPGALERLVVGVLGVFVGFRGFCKV